MAAQFPHSEDADPACGFTIGLALLDASTGKLGAALLHLADDLEEALGVYERTFAPQQPDGIAQARDIRVQRIMPPIPSAAESTVPEEAARIAGAFPGHVRPLYALAVTDAYACTPAEHALMRLTASCREAGVPWGGGLACGGGSLIEPCARGPRMGRMRRTRSERIDQLIAAIRSRRAVNDMIDGPASGILLAPCPLPAPLYPLATNFYERHCP